MTCIYEFSAEMTELEAHVVGITEDISSPEDDPDLPEEFRDAVTIF